MKRSAGILVYKKENDELKILLCHFGGPCCWSIDGGEWSLPKGEVSDNESILETAKREFNEETNLEVSTPLFYLGSNKTSSRKFLVMFYTESDFDLRNCKSNTFQMEYPKNSGNIMDFPEMDQYEWMDIIQAKKKIVKSQLYFLNKLEEKII